MKSTSNGDRTEKYPCFGQSKVGGGQNIIAVTALAITQWRIGAEETSEWRRFFYEGGREIDFER